MRSKVNPPSGSKPWTLLDFIRNVGLTRQTIRMIKKRQGNSKYRPHQGKKEIEKHRLRLEKKRKCDMNLSMPTLPGHIETAPTPESEAVSTSTSA